MRWERPLARKRSTISGGWSRSSPMTRPRASAAWSGGQVAAPRVDQRAHAVRRRRPAVRRRGRRRATSRRTSPTTCCQATRPRRVVVERPALAGDRDPVAGLATRSTRRRPARPRTHSSKRSPSISRSTRVAAPYGCGSSTTRRPAVERPELVRRERRPRRARHATTPTPAEHDHEQRRPTRRPPTDRGDGGDAPTATHDRVASPTRDDHGDGGDEHRDRSPIAAAARLRRMPRRRPPRPRSLSGSPSQPCPATSTKARAGTAPGSAAAGPFLALVAAGRARRARPARPRAVRRQGQRVRRARARRVRRARPARRRRAVLRATSVYPIGIAAQRACCGWSSAPSPPAGRPATRWPTWSDFWRNYRWLAGGIWLGALAALVDRPLRRSATRSSADAGHVTPSPADGSPRAWPGRCRARPRGRRPRRTARWRRGGRRSPAPSPGRCPGARRARRPSPG